MANTTIPANLIPKLWASKVWKEGVKASYFNKFTASDGSKAIHVNKDLSKNKGDKVTFGLQMNLTGAGVTGNSTLKGNEEALTMYDFGVSIDQVRNAVTVYDFDTQKSPYEMYPLIKNALVQWFSDWQDNTFITKLTGAPTAGEVFGVNGHAEAAIVAGDKLTAADISKARRMALLHAPQVKPLKVDGQEVYVMLVHPYAARDLKTDTTFLQAQQYANVRGSDNPIFTGALGMYDGVVLYEYERVSCTATGAASANVCHNLLLGQQAACFAVARDMYPIEQSDDYGNVQGLGVAFWGGIAKSQFNAKDYGIVQVLSGGAAG